MEIASLEVWHTALALHYVLCCSTYCTRAGALTIIYSVFKKNTADVFSIREGYFYFQEGFCTLQKQPGKKPGVII